MNILVTDQGFAPAPAPSDDSVMLPSDTNPLGLPEDWKNASEIRVSFPSFADGRGFTIAVQLRRSGYQGKLIAQGHVLADQYAMARRSGFDGVEISPDLAKRQPQAQWLARANWQAHDYQNRLKAS